MKVSVQKREEPRRRRTVTVVITLALVVALVAVIATRDWFDGYLAESITEKGGVPANGVMAKLTQLTTEAWPRQRASGTEKPLPKLAFDISRRNIGELAKKRAEALRSGYLIQEDGDLVPAKIRITNGDEHRTVDARVRLKGDFTDHLKGDKWSFRVKTKDDDHVLGMRVFSIQHPRTRGYAHEPLFLQHMRAEGVLAPRYEFVRVAVNGRDKGIMALEEHFSKELLEAQKRRESVIVRFDESLKWRTIHLMNQTVDFAAPYPLVLPFQSAKIDANPALQRDLQTATGLLRGFLSRDLRPSEVFDPDVCARFLAVAEIWGAEHALAWNNLRFYFNPITGLLEPIAFDANLQDAAFRFIPTALVSVYRLADHISADWLEDPRIREPFLRDLQRISRGFVQPEEQEKWRESEAALHRILHQEFPLIPNIAFEFYMARAHRLMMVDADNFRSMPLMPPNYPVLLHAFIVPSDQGFRLELYNLVPYPVEVTAIERQPESVTMDAKLPLTLPPTRGLKPPLPTRIELTSREDFALVKARVLAFIPGYPHTHSILEAQSYAPEAAHPVLPETTWEAVLAEHRYVRREGHIAHVGPGTVYVRQPLILPRGAALTVAPGTTMKFGPDAILLAHGPVQMPGTTEAPIALQPNRDGWPGIAVMHAGAQSMWSNVNITNTTGLKLGAWEPTGSVMFYESQVLLQNCTFSGNQSEDSLNIVRSKFFLENVTIEKCKSDALDTDFCEGIVRGGLFRETGGEGIDVSGTTIEVDGTKFEKIHDKALSIGEGSHAKVRNVQIHDVGTGAVSKDSSTLRIENSIIEDAKIAAVMAYTKKPEMGAAQVSVSNVSTSGTALAYRAQVGSSIEVDGKAVTPEDIDVDALYGTGPMRKEPVVPKNGQSATGNGPGDGKGN